MKKLRKVKGIWRWIKKTKTLKRSIVFIHSPMRDIPKKRKEFFPIFVIKVKNFNHVKSSWFIKVRSTQSKSQPQSKWKIKPEKSFSMDDHQETGDCDWNHNKGRLKLKTVIFLCVTFSDQRIIRVIQFNKYTLAEYATKKYQKRRKKNTNREFSKNRTESYDEKVVDEWHYDRYRSKKRKRWKEWLHIRNRKELWNSICIGWRESDENFVKFFGSKKQEQRWVFDRLTLDCVWCGVWNMMRRRLRDWRRKKMSFFVLFCFVFESEWMR